MILRRIVPNLNVDNATTGHDFYEEFLGLRKEFDMGWIASFRSPTNPSGASPAWPGPTATTSG